MAAERVAPLVGASAEGAAVDVLPREVHGLQVVFHLCRQQTALPSRQLPVRLLNSSCGTIKCCFGNLSMATLRRLSNFDLKDNLTRMT